jgi:hypothetical protein
VNFFNTHTVEHKDIFQCYIVVSLVSGLEKFLNQIFMQQGVSFEHGIFLKIVFKGQMKCIMNNENPQY